MHLISHLIQILNCRIYCSISLYLVRCIQHSKYFDETPMNEWYFISTMKNIQITLVYYEFTVPQTSLKCLIFQQHTSVQCITTIDTQQSSPWLAFNSQLKTGSTWWYKNMSGVVLLMTVPYFIYIRRDMFCHWTFEESGESVRAKNFRRSSSLRSKTSR